MTAYLTVHILLVVMLTAFMPVTAIAFLRNRVAKKASELGAFVDLTLFSHSGAGDLADRYVREEFQERSYRLPVAAATFVSLLGLISLFFGSYLIDGMPADQSNALLSGVALPADTDLKPLWWQSLVALTFAFLGAFVWSCQNVVRRFVAEDLAPVEYFNATLRMVLAPLLSLMLAFLLAAAPVGDRPMEILPVIAFLTGMIPGAALFYLQDKVLIFAQWSERSAHALPLRLIEGLNRYHEVRLEEAGVDNVQNLAEANIFELALKTPYNPAQMIDWIAQAKLVVYAKDDITALRGQGVRSAFDLRGMDDARIEQLAERSGVEPLVLRGASASVAQDATLESLWTFRKGLGARIPSETARPGPPRPPGALDAGLRRRDDPPAAA